VSFSFPSLLRDDEVYYFSLNKYTDSFSRSFLFPSDARPLELLGTIRRLFLVLPSSPFPFSGLRDSSNFLYLPSALCSSFPQTSLRRWFPPLPDERKRPHVLFASATVPLSFCTRSLLTFVFADSLLSLFSHFKLQIGAVRFSLFASPETLFSDQVTGSQPSYPF